MLQDVHLFSGTIAGNIRLGDAGDHRRRGRGARRRRCTPTGSSSGCRAATTRPVAERGATLSVGQKQLLSFARALAFDPRVLVLDEATSSVDTETELLIRDALHVLMAGRTTIAIAHRLSTIQDMDKILVLHKGQLREAGTHQELLAQRGIYYKLYQLQYKDQEASRPSSTLIRDARVQRRLANFDREPAELALGVRLGSDGRDGPSAEAAARRRLRAGGTGDRPGGGVLALGFQPSRSTVIAIVAAAELAAPRCSSTCRCRCGGPGPPGRCP